MKPKEPRVNMRRKIDREDGFQEGEFVEAWSKKRIAIAGLVALLVFGFLGYNLITYTEKTIKNPPEELKVLGETTDDVKLPTKKDVEGALDSAKETLQQITSDNITSSQAAIQQIIKDLEKVQGEDKQPIDVMCELVCKK